MEPTRPKNLNPLAQEVLAELRANSASEHIVLGGGVALSHYHEYRPTVDLDAWWDGEAFQKHPILLKVR